MASSDLIPSDRDRPEPASLEVEFALVLARMIDSLKNNPEDMRQAIYELARHKLQEQFPDVSAEEKDRTQQALETAIRGVEAFTEQRDGVVAQPVNCSSIVRVARQRRATLLSPSWFLTSSHARL